MKLLSFGEILFDIYEDMECLGGAPLNFAAYTAMQGTETYLLSAVGFDDLGKKAVTEIEKLGIKTDLIQICKNKQTGKCIVSLDASGLPLYNLLDDVAYDEILFDEKAKSFNFDILAFGTLSLRNGNNKSTLKRLINENSFSDIYVDLNLRAPFYSSETVKFALENATLLKLSDEELPYVEDNFLNGENDEEKALKLLSNMFSKIKYIILTKGGNGSVCYDCKAKKIYTCKAEKCKVVSTVGAGDSFGATFLSAMLKGKSIDESLSVASKVSAYVVGHSGAIPEHSNPNQISEQEFSAVASLKYS